MLDYVWLIPLLPAASALVCGVWGKRLKTWTGWISIASMLATFVLAVGAAIPFFADPGRTAYRRVFFEWIHVGSFQVEYSILVDPLTVVMLAVVSIVGTLVFIYSTGYMHGDAGYARFFSFMSLFAASMYLLVIADNFLLLFIGWEGVGLCSYLLIGYYMEQEWCAAAGTKAFVVNRIGDLGFALGLAMIFGKCGSLDFERVFAQAPTVFAYGGIAVTMITILLFIGAVGKSAQIPLFVWLPDAMAGPTPVSALIHAATMVTAGVYMVARCNVLYALAPVSMAIVAVIGTATAFLGASIAMTQRDIKKVLAYSTISQLGYMFLALGVGAFTAGIFHLYTHAFFKGALFLCAGSVIHAAAREQDMFKMGGLRKAMPMTWATYFVATLAIAGCPLTAGFFSKDEILWRAVSSRSSLGNVVWLIGIVTALMTAIYMFRSLFLSFHGECRLSPDAAKHVHESPPNMTLPLILLAAGSLAAGWVGLPDWMGGSAFAHFLEPVMAQGRALIVEHSREAAEHSRQFELGITGISVVAFFVGCIIARRYFLTGFPSSAERAARRLGILYTISLNRWWWDDAYNAIIVRGFLAFVRLIGWFDLHIVDGIVNATGRRVAALGEELRRYQNGRVQHYALWILVGVNLILMGLLCSDLILLFKRALTGIARIASGSP
jgi:NADH-quinone oxidoreductase subunit L